MRSFRPSKARTQQLDQRARRMRHVSTTSEALVFEAVRGGKLGVTFRRQVPLLGRYIADLFASAVRLVVEIDGPYHRERREADARRDRALERAGYTVLRLEEELVMCDLPSALARIRTAIGRG